MNFIPDIWPIGPIDAEPLTRLSDWRVFQCKLPKLDARTIHLVGYCIRYREGRVTSPVKTFDPTKGLAKTRSGRIYELLGSPGSCRDADHTWAAWIELHDATDIVEITDEHWSQIQAHRDSEAGASS